MEKTETPDIISAVFNPYLELDKIRHDRWVQQFHNDMWLKHGSKATGVGRTQNDMYVDGHRMITVVLEVVLKEKK